MWENPFKLNMWQVDEKHIHDDAGVYLVADEDGFGFTTRLVRFKTLDAMVEYMVDKVGGLCLT